MLILRKVLQIRDSNIARIMLYACPSCLSFSYIFYYIYIYDKDGRSPNYIDKG